MVKAMQKSQEDVDGLRVQNKALRKEKFNRVCEQTVVDRKNEATFKELKKVARERRLKIKQLEAKIQELEEKLREPPVVDTA